MDFQAICIEGPGEGPSSYQFKDRTSIELSMEKITLQVLSNLSMNL